MSFMKTLAKVAVGFAAAQGVKKYQRMGGMSGMKDMFSGSSASGMTGQLGQMAERMGVPGGAKAIDDMMASFGMGGGSGAKGASPEAGAAGIGGLMSAMGGAAAASGQHADDMMSGIFANSPVAVASENNAKLMIRSMIQAAKADGEIDDEEQGKILDQLRDAPDEEIAFVKEQLAAPLDVTKLASDTDEAMKAQVYSTSLMAIRVDSTAETTYLKQLSQALGLSKEARDQVHVAMGLPPLES